MKPAPENQWPSVYSGASARSTRRTEIPSRRTRRLERQHRRSDLHLGDNASVAAFDRPFRTTEEMDQAMMDAWYELVGDDDTIVCLGDVSVDGSTQPHHQRWWREAPGAKWLVIGNHDLDPVTRRGRSKCTGPRSRWPRPASRRCC